MATLVASRRDLQTITFLLAQVWRCCSLHLRIRMEAMFFPPLQLGNEVLNFVLKRLVNEARPASTRSSLLSVPLLTLMCVRGSGAAPRRAQFGNAVQSRAVHVFLRHLRLLHCPPQVR